MHGEDERGDLLNLPYTYDEVDAIICTEVLEHCTDPFGAVREHRVLKPGGLLLITSPFIQPWHGTDTCADCWQFMDQGWALLLAATISVDIRTVKWTMEGKALYDPCCSGSKGLGSRADHRGDRLSL